MPKNLTGTVFVAVCLAIGSIPPAQAVQVTWNLAANDGCGTPNTCGSATGPAGDVRVFTVEADGVPSVLRVTAFSADTNDPASNFVREWLSEYPCAGGPCGVGVTGTGSKDIVVLKLGNPSYVPLSFTGLDTCSFVACLGPDVEAWVGGNGIGTLAVPTWTTLSLGGLGGAGFTKYAPVVDEVVDCFGFDCFRRRVFDLNATGANLSGTYVVVATDRDAAHPFTLSSFTGRVDHESIAEILAVPVAEPEGAVLLLLLGGALGLGRPLLHSRRRSSRAR
jgi:hypothetical protein